MISDNKSPFRKLHGVMLGLLTRTKPESAEEAKKRLREAYGHRVEATDHHKLDEVAEYWWARRKRNRARYQKYRRKPTSTKGCKRGQPKAEASIELTIAWMEGIQELIELAGTTKNLRRIMELVETLGGSRNLGSLLDLLEE